MVAKDPIDLHVGEQLKRRRLELGLSQSELGEPENVTYQQIQKYERGTNRISASKLLRFAHFLKVPVSYFFEGAEQFLPRKVVEPPRLPDLRMADSPSHFKIDCAGGCPVPTMEELSRIGQVYTEIASVDLRARYIAIGRLLGDHLSGINKEMLTEMATRNTDCSAAEGAPCEEA